ncbi:MAG: hypothetical protein HOK06_01435 [Rhodospirillaceae bacterium]|nr:hypothetical protein [Rhodospirillaceae bacterium]
MAPLVLGIILGKILDDNLRRSLVLTDGELLPLFTRPICAVIWIVTLATIVMSIDSIRNPIMGVFRRILPGKRSN